MINAKLGRVSFGAGSKATIDLTGDSLIELAVDSDLKQALIRNSGDIAAESGVVPDYDVTTWYGLYGPKGMPKPVTLKLNKVLNEILEEPETKARLTKTGVIVKGSTPEAWAGFVAAEYKKWSAVREKAGLEQR